MDTKNTNCSRQIRQLRQASIKAIFLLFSQIVGNASGFCQCTASTTVAANKVVASGDQLYLLTSSLKQVLISSDRGNTWQTPSGLNNLLFATQIPNAITQMYASNGQIFFIQCATDGPSTAIVYADSQGNWQRINAPQASCGAFLTASGNTWVMCGGVSATRGTCIYTTNAGKTWLSMGTPAGDTDQFPWLFPSSSNILLYQPLDSNTKMKISRLAIPAMTWSDVTPNQAHTIMILEHSQYFDSLIFGGPEGQVPYNLIFTTDGGTSWLTAPSITPSGSAPLYVHSIASIVFTFTSVSVAPPGTYHRTIQSSRDLGHTWKKTDVSTASQPNPMVSALVGGALGKLFFSGQVGTLMCVLP
jgi:hypothetical protein